MTEKTIVKGNVTGKVLKSSQPINFLGAIDKKTGSITDKKHDLSGKSIKDTILLFPHGIGSSVGAYTIYSLKSNNVAPLAMACQKVDLTVASGCALANIPLFILSADEYNSIKGAYYLKNSNGLDVNLKPLSEIVRDETR